MLLTAVTVGGPGAAPGSGVAGHGARPVGLAEFAEAMARLGPFEARPHLAVALSGGPDSWALALLARDWVAGRDGRITALIVDHALRPESAREARRVAGECRARGIPAVVLPWTGPKPASGVQEAARAARYALLADWCAAAGVVHLATGHTADDQAETVLMRLARGSAVEGLAGMPAERSLGAARLIRPLLHLPKDRLVATCRAHGQSWIDDPTNRSAAMARGRLRAVADLLGAEGFAPERIAATARSAAGVRSLLDDLVSRALAEAVQVFPEGHILLDPAVLATAPAEIRRRVLTRCLRTAGARSHPPRTDAVDRLAAALWTAGARRTRTLGGCCIVPGCAGRWIVCREPAAACHVLRLQEGQQALWDDRFAVAILRAPGPVTVTRLESAGARIASADLDRLRDADIPGCVRAALPVVRAGDGSPALPQVFGRGRPEEPDPREPGEVVAWAAFVPRIPLASACFTVA